jgi:hypothetical protein
MGAGYRRCHCSGSAVSEDARMSLAPGDMCVIIRNGRCGIGEDLLALYGLVVTLVRTCDCERCWLIGEPGTVWVCAGVPASKDVHSISQALLRRIPPAPMEDEDFEETTRSVIA